MQHHPHNNNNNNATKKSSKTAGRNRSLPDGDRHIADLYGVGRISAADLKEIFDNTPMEGMLPTDPRVRDIRRKQKVILYAKPDSEVDRSVCFMRHLQGDREALMCGRCVLARCWPKKK